MLEAIVVFATIVAGELNHGPVQSVSALHVSNMANLVRCTCNSKCTTTSGNVGVCQYDGSCVVSTQTANCDRPKCVCGDACTTDGLAGICWLNGVCHVGTAKTQCTSICSTDASCPDYQRCMAHDGQLFKMCEAVACPCGNPCTFDNGKGVCQLNGDCVSGGAAPTCPPVTPNVYQKCDCGKACTTSTGTKGLCQVDGRCAVNVQAPPNCPKCVCGDSCTQDGKAGICWLNGECHIGTAKTQCIKICSTDSECPDHQRCLVHGDDLFKQCQPSTCACGNKCTQSQNGAGFCQPNGHCEAATPKCPAKCTCGERCTSGTKPGFCGSNGVCAAGTTKPSCVRKCTKDGDCPDGQHCTGALIKQCTPPQKCSMTATAAAANGILAHCPSGYYCVGGLCQKCAANRCPPVTCAGPLLPIKMPNGCPGCPKCAATIPHASDEVTTGKINEHVERSG